MGKNKRIKVVRQVTVFILLLSAVIVCGQPVLASAAETRPIELGMSLSIVEMNDRWLKVMKPWVETIQRESKGKVKINPFFVGTLAKEQQNYQGLVDGLIDISYATFISEWGRFPVTEIGMVSPPSGKFYNRPSRVMWDLYTQFPEFRKEYAQVKVLSFNALPLSTIATSTKVTKMEDMKGKKISTGCRAQLTALGAQPIFMPFEQCYDALKKGVFNGIECANVDYVANKFYEVAKYKLTNSPIKAYPVGLAMSITTWNKLGPELQAIFTKYSGAYFADMADKALAASEEVAKQQAIKNGAEYVTLSPAEAERWAKAIEPTRAQFSEGLNKRGLPGTQIVKTMDELIAKYSK